MRHRLGPKVAQSSDDTEIRKRKIIHSSDPDMKIGSFADIAPEDREEFLELLDRAFLRLD